VGNTITLLGGTFSTAAVLTVTSVSGGAVTGFTITNQGVYTVGSTTFTQSATSGTGSGATFNLGVFGLHQFANTTPGVYTVTPPILTQGATSGAGTGGTFAILYAVNTVSVTSGGSYTVNGTTFTQSSTSGNGINATFNTPTYGVLTTIITTPGSLSALASNPAAQGSTSGSGTGATFTMGYGILSVAVAGTGVGYDGLTQIVTTPVGGATFDFTITGSDTPISIPFEFPNGDLPEQFHITANIGQAYDCWYADPAGFTPTGGILTIIPASGVPLDPGTVSIQINA
jgi:hypothetical protein